MITLSQALSSQIYLQLIYGKPSKKKYSTPLTVFFSPLSDSSNPVSSPIIAQTKPRIESADDLEVRVVF